MTERLHTCTGERGTVACEACADTIAVPGEATFPAAAVGPHVPGARDYSSPERVAPLLKVARRAALLEAKAACVAYLNQDGLAEETIGAEECIARIDALIAKGSTP